ncbi:chaperone modulatory protein CbpM [Pedobacter sp. UYP24]
METELISIQEYCGNYEIEPSFIVALEDCGIITLTIIETSKYIHVDQIKELDTYKHLHYDLEINIEGIDAIRHLLQKVIDMQQRIEQLNNRLYIHE